MFSISHPLYNWCAPRRDGIRAPSISLYTRARGTVNPSHRGACARIHDVCRRNVDRMKWLTPLNERGCLVLNSNHQSYLYSKHCPAPLTRKFPPPGPRVTSDSGRQCGRRRRQAMSRHLDHALDCLINDIVCWCLGSVTDLVENVAATFRLVSMLY